MKVLFLLLVSLIHLQQSCKSAENNSVKVNTTTTSGSGSSTPEKAGGSNQDAVLPVNWPWRGVSVESKKTVAADIAYLKSVHVNFIRIFIKGDKRAKREGIAPASAFYKELEWTDSILDAAKKEGITCMIAFNNLVLDPNSEIDDKRPSFWNNKAMIDSAYNMVDIIVRRYRNRGDELTAYEVIGEPAINVDGKTRTPDKIEDFFKNVLQTIRKYDQKRFFLLTPGPWGKPVNYRNFEGYQIKDKRLIYGAHMYLPDEYTHQGVKKRPRGFEYPGMVDMVYWDKAIIRKKFEALAAFERRTGNLIFIGEFQSVRWAKGANIWLKDVLDILEENKWSWAMYGFQCDTDFWDPYYDVVDRKEEYERWKIEFAGKETEGWKLMKEYFSKNKK
jgi:hypothetical protein